MHNVRKENGSPAEILGLFFSYSMPIDASCQEKSSSNFKHSTIRYKTSAPVDLKTGIKYLRGLFTVDSFCTETFG